jgi:hypothetical protein
MVPEAMDALTPEERHQVYRMLRLQAAVMMGKALEISEMFGEGDVFCPTEAPSSTL